MPELRLEFIDLSSIDAEAIFAEYKRSVPPKDRAVQIGVRNGSVFVRIAGVKVLERHSGIVGVPYSVYSDRPTGTVLLMTIECVETSGCTCMPTFRPHVLRWQPETFEAIDRHPCRITPASGDAAQVMSCGLAEGSWAHCIAAGIDPFGRTVPWNEALCAERG